MITILWFSIFFYHVKFSYKTDADLRFSLFAVPLYKYARENKSVNMNLSPKAEDGRFTEQIRPINTVVASERGRRPRGGFPELILKILKV